MSSSPQVEATSKRKAARKSPFRRAPGRPATHGGWLLTRALKHVSVDGVDGRTKVGAALRRVRDDLVDHLAGEPTAPEMLVVEECAKKAVVAQAIGAWLLAHDGDLVRDGALLPVVAQWSALQDSLARMLSGLGFARRARAVQSLQDYLAARLAGASEDAADR